MNPNITLKDIGGYEAEKKEVSQIIKFIKNYEEFKAQGAVLPKGAVIIGEPGVGKTMFATAMANEADVPLFVLDSESVCNKDVPVTIALNNVFDEASKHVPCIVLIDEIDKLLPESGPFTPPSERDRDILTILLTRIDGTRSTEGIFIIATANVDDFHELPDSLIRSGRLEKKIRLAPPNLEARQKILSLYMTRPIFKKVDIKELAKRTRGFTDATLCRLVNEVLIDAISDGKKSLKVDDFTPRLHSIYSNGLKNQPKRGTGNPSVAYHELGHFLAGFVLRGETGSVTIESYGPNGGMYMRHDNGENEMTKTKDVRNEIIVDLAGLAATEVIYGEKCLGAVSDIQNAQRAFNILARNGCLGFGIVVGGNGDRPMSSSPTRDALEEKRAAYLEECYQEAKAIISKNMEFMEEAFVKLMRYRTLSEKQMRELAKKYIVNKGEKPVQPSEEISASTAGEKRIESAHSACVNE